LRAVDNVVEAAEIRREVRELVAPEGYIRGEPAAVEVVRGVLRANCWLRECAVHDNCGERHDLAEALLTPQVLGSLGHVYQGTKLFAVIRKYQEISELVILGANWKLQVDTSSTERHRVRLFVGGVGMLTFDRWGKRNLLWGEGFKEQRSA
jgi:hypothetical protein